MSNRTEGTADITGASVGTGAIYADLLARRCYAEGNSGVLQARPSLLIGSPAEATKPARGGLPRHVVRRVQEHIDRNIDQRIKIASLAKLANLSTCYFVRAFKQSVGFTPRDYLIRRRIQRTIELLSGTDMRLSEIALVAGFVDQSHCVRRFGQHVGTSPRNYRRAYPRRVTS